MAITTTYLLTGDIGGTNSRLSLYATDASCCTDNAIHVMYYRNQEYLPEALRSDPELFAKNIIIPFLQACWSDKEDELVPLDQNVQIFACLATAGIVSNNNVQMTNLGNLVVDGNCIQNDVTDPYLKHIKVCRLINDFVAQGYGCLTLQPGEVRKLYGPVEAKDLTKFLQTASGPKVCTGAGTGLGECYLTAPDSADSEHYTCYPSEGGHVEYAPRNDLEVRMWKFLSEKYCSKDRISVERVVSGKGLANVYEFLAHEFPERIIASVHEEFLTAGDEQGKVVAMNAKEGSLCKQAMSIMMSAYGCEVGSAAIKWIPTGGLFVTGGLTPKNIQYIEGATSEFMLAYLKKGRVSPLLERIPLFAVMVEDLGVRGAHKAAKMLYEHYHGEGEKVEKKAVTENKVLLAVTTILGISLGVLIGRSHRS